MIAPPILPKKLTFVCLQNLEPKGFLTDKLPHFFKCIVASCDTRRSSNRHSVDIMLPGGTIQICNRPVGKKLCKSTKEIQITFSPEEGPQFHYCGINRKDVPLRLRIMLQYFLSRICHLFLLPAAILILGNEKQLAL
ncbi:unnamed protein product [Amoebophrya sp. A120]|nr:unnamed protein product [Amoebophrya sp. A120]|eukprot:GSA120T00025354001.1